MSWAPGPAPSPRARQLVEYSERRCHWLRGGPNLHLCVTVSLLAPASLDCYCVVLQPPFRDPTAAGPSAQNPQRPRIPRASTCRCQCLPRRHLAAALAATGAAAAEFETTRGAVPMAAEVGEGGEAAGRQPDPPTVDHTRRGQSRRRSSSIALWATRSTAAVRKSPPRRQRRQLHRRARHHSAPRRFLDLLPRSGPFPQP